MEKPGSENVQIGQVKKALVTHEGNYTGNPDQITSKKSIVDAFTKGATIQNASKAGGIHRHTYGAWVDPAGTQYDPTFASDCEAARDAGVEIVEDRLFRATGGKGKASVTAQIFFLKCRKREIYGDKAQVEIKGEMTLRDLIKNAAKEVKT